MSRRKDKQKESARRSLRVVVLILQLGISMLSCIFLCGIIGLVLSDKTGSLILFPLCLVLGILAGFRSCYKMITRFVSLKNPEPEEGVIYTCVYENEDEEEETFDGGPPA